VAAKFDKEIYIKNTNDPGALGGHFSRSSWPPGAGDFEEGGSAEGMFEY